jgi:hypothetical protein
MSRGFPTATLAIVASEGRVGKIAFLLHLVGNRRPYLRFLFG